MNRTELREKLNKIDCDNCNQYDLLNLFESIKFSDEGLNKLSEMLENGASDKKIHDFLYSALVEGYEEANWENTRARKPVTESMVTYDTARLDDRIVRNEETKPYFNKMEDAIGPEELYGGYIEEIKNIVVNKRIQTLDDGVRVSFAPVFDALIHGDFDIYDSTGEFQNNQWFRFDTSLMPGDFDVAGWYAKEEMQGEIDYSPEYEIESTHGVRGKVVYALNGMLSIDSDAPMIDITNEINDYAPYPESDEDSDIDESLYENQKDGLQTFWYWTDPGNYKGTVRAKDKEDAYLQIEADLGSMGVYMTDETVTIMNREEAERERFIDNEFLPEAYSYFETDDAVYFIHNDKHLKHRKDWDTIDAFKYHNVEIPVSEYDRAWRSINASSNKEDKSLSEAILPRNAKKIKATHFGTDYTLEKSVTDWKIIDSTKDNDELVGKLVSPSFLRTWDNIEVVDVDKEYKPKRTEEVKVLQGYYDLGWEDLVTYSQPYDYQEIKDDLKSYKDNEKRAFRVITRRVPIKDESLSEDTVKQGSQWVNKGKEGTHGKFKTKKEADAQRKAMFARGFKEGVEEEKTVIYKEDGVYKTTPESNYNSRIQNARKIHEVDWAESAEDIINYYIKNGWAKSSDEFKIVESVKEDIEDDNSSFDYKGHEIKLTPYGYQVTFDNGEEIEFADDREAMEYIDSLNEGVDDKDILPDDHIFYENGEDITEEEDKALLDFIEKFFNTRHYEIKYENLPIEYECVKDCDGIRVGGYRPFDYQTKKSIIDSWTYTPPYDIRIDIYEYLVDNFQDRLDVSDIKNASKDVYEFLKDKFYGDAQDNAIDNYEQ